MCKKTGCERVGRFSCGVVFSARASSMIGRSLQIYSGMCLMRFHVECSSIGRYVANRPSRRRQPSASLPLPPAVAGAGEGQFSLIEKGWRSALCRPRFPYCVARKCDIRRTSLDHGATQHAAKLLVVLGRLVLQRHRRSVVIQSRCLVHVRGVSAVLGGEGD